MGSASRKPHNLDNTYPHRQEFGKKLQTDPRPNGKQHGRITTLTPWEMHHQVWRGWEKNNEQYIRHCQTAGNEAADSLAKKGTRILQTYFQWLIIPLSQTIYDTFLTNCKKKTLNKKLRTNIGKRKLFLTGQQKHLPLFLN